MLTPWAANGSTSAARVAASLSKPIPRRPSPRRLQKEAFMALRCAGRPGVPASTSRNGASARTSWLTFNNSWPTSRSSTWASSSRTTSGRLRHRAVSRAVRFCADREDAAHSASPTPVMPSLRGRIRLMPVAGSSASTRACSVRIRLGDNRAMSTLPARRQRRSNQLSNTVLPLPRGPISATSWGGDLARTRSARQRVMTACSPSRPVRAGGAAPVPG